MTLLAPAGSSPPGVSPSRWIRPPLWALNRLAHASLDELTELTELAAAAGGAAAGDPPAGEPA